MRYRREHAAWQAKYDARAPKAGDPAADFQLCDVDGQQSVRLSDFRGKKPVVLVFGSFT
jgi:peroxiredoxin